MNAAKWVQVLLVAVAVLFAVTLGLSMRGGRDDMGKDNFKPPAWMTALGPISAPFSPKLDVADVRLNGQPMPASLTISETTTLTIREENAAPSRTAAFIIEGDPVLIRYEADPPPDDLEEDERVQIWPEQNDQEKLEENGKRYATYSQEDWENSAGDPPRFAIFEGGGEIIIEPKNSGSDGGTTITLRQ